MRTGTAILLVLLFALFPLQRVSADIGPKPKMEFEFTQAFAGDPVQIVRGAQLECKQSNCLDGTPLKDFGAARFRCTKNTCDSISYGFAPYNRLEITFSDGRLRRSNIFEPIDFNSHYKVTIRQGDLWVEPVKLWIDFEWWQDRMVGYFLLLVQCILPIVLFISIIFDAFSRWRKARARPQ